MPYGTALIGFPYLNFPWAICQLLCACKSAKEKGDMQTEHQAQSLSMSVTSLHIQTSVCQGTVKSSAPLCR